MRARKLGLVRLLQAILVTALLLPATAPAQESAAARNFHGLLRVRDMTPFGFLRLDMRPAPPAFAGEKGTTLEVDLGYQNTWVRSPGVADYLASRPRGPLTNADLERLRALPGENYLVDGEVALLDFALNHPLTDRLSVFAVLSVGTYGGGFMDGTIEAVHRGLNIGDAGRPGLRRNQVNIFLNLEGLQSADLNATTRNGILDPVFGARYILAGTPGTDNLVVDAAIKLPVVSDEWFSTGRTDLGAQITYQRFAGRHAFYASGSLVYHRGSPDPLPSSATVVPTVTGGYEYRLGSYTNVITQLSVGRGPFTSKETSQVDLRGTKYQFSVGVRHRVDRCYWTAAFTENLRNFNNTPDFGIQLGLGYNL